MQIAAAESPALPPPPAGPEEVARLLRSTEFVRNLDERALVRLVPAQSGLSFVGCPNCAQGSQEGQLIWDTKAPDELHCRYCGHRYPSAQYPMNAVETVHTPAGGVARYPYWANAQGYRHYFQAKRDSAVSIYLAERIPELARLYLATGDESCARRAVALIDRFAQVFPGWCYHYDFPFQQKQIYDGVVAPKDFRPGYRTSRWSRWAFGDVPLPLVQAYDWTRGSPAYRDLSRAEGVDVAARIERNLFRPASEQVLANPEIFSNMSPIAWRSLVITGRVIGEPRYVHEVVRRLRRFMEIEFFYDGSWHESAAYGQMTVSGVEEVLAVLNGYSDPEGYRDPEGGGRFDRLDLAREFPSLRRARAAVTKMRFPDGRLIPIGDTKGGTGGAHDSFAPFILPGHGIACLGGGSGAGQIQLAVTWGGGYGHSHADVLGVLLLAHGREMLSDLGYTHTAYRGWTQSTVAHNTVVIDRRNQRSNNMARVPSDGSLRRFDTKDPRVQVISVDAPRAYPDLAKTYRRTIVLVEAGAGERYAVDLFEVEGGRTHDYFLHGETGGADLSVPLDLKPLATLLPDDYKWRKPRNEGELERSAETNFAYGFLRNLQTADLRAGAPLLLVFRPRGGAGPGLRVAVLPEEGSRLIAGEDPSVREAGEDDAKLEKHLRPFFAIRHEAGDGRSVFAAVVEPFASSPFLSSVERLPATGASLALRVRIGDREDLVVIGAASPAAIEAGGLRAAYRGEIGVLSVRNGAVEHAYSLGEGGWACGAFRLDSKGPCSRPLSAAEPGALIVGGGPAPAPEAGSIVRVVTADGWVYPYTVDAAEAAAAGLRIRVVEPTGFMFDAAGQILRQTAFPQRDHAGPVSVDWIPR